jgi:antitoxin HicB
MNTREETITHKEYSYTVVFEPAPEGGYTVTCPALPGLVTEGDTLVEARAMAADAIRCYLESLKKDEMPIPVEEDEDEPLREKITVHLTKV